MEDGAEFLLTLNHPYKLTAITESYEPNVRLCEEKLSLLGIEVKQVYKDEKLPFLDKYFDIIINRHESFCACEVSRILKEGGYFITQQVGGKNNFDLSTRLINDFQPKFPEHDLKNNVVQLKATGFEMIKTEESFPTIRFYDVGALAYFAKIIEWEFPGFSVETCFRQLHEMQKEVEKNKYIEGTEHRFLIVARKCKEC
ncbi:MAG: SAM-dependent methyltransferase [Niameybacter sp.]